MWFVWEDVSLTIKSPGKRLCSPASWGRVWKDWMRGIRIWKPSLFSLCEVNSALAGAEGKRELAQSCGSFPEAGGQMCGVLHLGGCYFFRRC